MSTHTPLPPAQDERVNDAVLEQRPETVAHLFRDRVAKSPNAEAFRFAEDDSWASVTWVQGREGAYRLAAGRARRGWGAGRCPGGGAGGPGRPALPGRVGGGPARLGRFGGGGPPPRRST